MLWPLSIDAPAPSEDMPISVRKDYLEAGVVLPHSPRAAAALLRLAIQRLCRELGQEGENINDDIAALVKEGTRPSSSESVGHCTSYCKQRRSSWPRCHKKMSRKLR
ncbi:DUF4145 domain-containing protein [Chelativorans sp.]|uniref:DUF4145 domain-containing protein n=1 Tax=Chelativorans sp. TaxID=2203393 RepID=UPI0035C76A4F